MLKKIIVNFAIKLTIFFNKFYTFTLSKDNLQFDIQSHKVLKLPIREISKLKKISSLESV